MKNVSILELRNNLDSFDCIELSDGYKWKLPGTDKIIIHKYNTIENPFYIEDFENSLDKDIEMDKFLKINPDWATEHTAEFNELLYYIARNYPKEELRIESILVSDTLIDCLCMNHNLKKLDLGNYTLTEKDYLKFKNSNIETVHTEHVSEELTNVFDPLIGFNMEKSLIGYKNYKSLIKARSVNLSKEEEIQYLKYIPKDCVINVEDLTMLEKLDKLSIGNPICLKVRDVDAIHENQDIIDKNTFNEYMKTHKFKNPNISIEHDGMRTDPLDFYTRMEDILIKMVEPAKDLSPFEKYIYAYNLAKQYKPYKENKEDLSASRDLYSILLNEYMVCVGFAEMFGDLLDKLGIKSESIGVNTVIPYDSERYQAGKEFGGHARRYTHIVDPKYGIDGFYTADPTWDNNMEKDMYSYLALTASEMHNDKTRFKLEKNSFGGIDLAYELFTSENIEEFYAKINFYLDESKKIKLQKNKKTSYRDDVSELGSIIKEMLKSLEILDSEMSKSLSEKYGDLIDKNDESYDKFQDVLYEIGTYIISKNNNIIGGETIFKAVVEVYRAKGMSEEEIRKKLEEVIPYNVERYDERFPVQTITTDRGTEIIADNKFENAGKTR